MLAHDCPGKVATAAPAYLEHIRDRLDRAEAQKERQKRLEALQAAPLVHGGHTPTQEYQKQAQRLLVRFGDGADLSRMDWMIAQDMAKSGRFTVQDIEKGIRECSPNVESRKAGHTEDYYAKRTAANAGPSTAEQQHRQEQQAQTQERQAQRSTDRDGPDMTQ